MASNRLSIAVLGFWHVHAEGYAREVIEHPDTDLVAVWDDDAERGALEAKGLGIEFTDDLPALLGREDIDGVVVTAATNQHREVILAAVNAGKHVFTEKLLAPTVAECEELIAAAASSGVSLFVSLPQLYEAATIAAMDAVAAGKLGVLNYSRVRLAHDGWINGWLPERFADREAAIGGAFADLGCHAAYLTQLFHGQQPLTVSAQYSSVTGRAVEDNATVTATFAGGALGVMEASLVTSPGAFAFELRGSEGSMLNGFNGAGLVAKGPHFDPESWTTVELPDAAPLPLSQWISKIRSGEPADDNLHAAVELTRLVAAANRSAEIGQSLPYA